MQAIDNCYIAANAVVLGDVVLADGANIWYGCVVRGDLARITLGPRANLQDGCIVHTDSDAPLDMHGRRIGKDTLIGIGARLLSGCEIGPECLVAAGAVVPEGRRIPPRSVVMGLPGKVVRPITDEEVARTRRINAHYLELARRHARGEFRRYPAPAQSVPPAQSSGPARP